MKLVRVCAKLRLPRLSMAHMIQMRRVREDEICKIFEDCEEKVIV